MGFTMFEKRSLQKFVRPDEETALLRKAELEYAVYEFLKTEGLLRQVRDYGIFPSRYYHKLNSAENIILSKFFDNSFNIYDFTKELGKKLTCPFRIQMDCALIIKHNEKIDDFRFVWAQRSLAFNNQKFIRDKDDLESLLAEVKLQNNDQLMKRVYDIHQNQSIFEKSGYRPLRLISAVFFLSKIFLGSTKHGPNRETIAKFEKI